MLHSPLSMGGTTPIYLDANATEPLRPAARDALLDGLSIEGNPSSVHAAGRKARSLLEQARRSLAGAFGREADCCVFTSGGTEADTLAVHAFGKHAGRRILIGATEHDAVRRVAPHAGVIPVNEQGVIDCSALEALLVEAQKAGETALVCVMAANNETGVYAPLEDIATLCRQYEAFLHIDAVQAAGRMPMPGQSCAEWDYFSKALEGGFLKEASLAVSAHKMGGPKGSGALLLPEDKPLMPLLPGGGQERGRRGGTPALAAHMGMVAALQESQKQDWVAIAALRDQLQDVLVAAGAELVGGKVARLPNTLNVILPGVASQMQLMMLDIAGFCVSAGSACSSGKVARSHVLEAMGLGERAGQALRVSLPWNVTKESVEAFGNAYIDMVKHFSERGLVKAPQVCAQREV